MKLILVISVVIVVAAANTADYRTQCIKELNIQRGTIEKFRKGEYDEHVPCFTECVFKKMGTMSDGQFNMEALTNTLGSETKTPEELRSDIEECIDNTITDNCQKSFAAFTCFKRKNLYKIRRA
ncbi:general odorant-binding protein 99a-like [Chironomus tepperi]|uniref:general odorant-binding protein 99a-like n=1 Tax=Chironomus tepperi TaxID=113505 RepID=UPI00391EEFD0